MSNTNDPLVGLWKVPELHGCKKHKVMKQENSHAPSTHEDFVMQNFLCDPICNIKQV